MEKLRAQDAQFLPDGYFGLYCGAYKEILNRLLEVFNNSCYAKRPLSSMLKADSNSIARLSEARYI
jgi:hypothetical protein